MALVSNIRNMSIRGLFGLLAIAVAVSGPASLAYFAANGQAVAHENVRLISATELPGLRRLGLPGVDLQKASAACSMRLVSDPYMMCFDDELLGRVNYFAPAFTSHVSGSHEGPEK